MRLLAFTGTRYAASSGDLQDLAAPPFDQIDSDLRDRLQASSPHQFATSRAPSREAKTTPTNTARSIYQEWTRSGALDQDERPSLYPYAIELPDGSRRLGLCGLVGVEPGSEGSLRHTNSPSRSPSPTAWPCSRNCASISNP